jgi:thioredoxin reductase (NADPH)
MDVATPGPHADRDAMSASPSDAALAFPSLTPAEIDALRPFGNERDVAVGDVLFAEGARDFCFFVVLAGDVEIVEHSSGAERLVVTHTPGQFTGDVDMLTGRASLVTGRAVTNGRVLALDGAALREAVRALPEVGERLLKAFLQRRVLLLQNHFSGLRVIGSRFSPDAHRIRDFATRNQVPFTWIDVERDDRAEALLEHFGVKPDETPIVIFNGEMLTRPSNNELALRVGLEAAVASDDLYDLAIVGAGPAGLAAAVYAASEGLNTILFDSAASGGQAGTSSRIENYLGFPTGISGADLTRNATLQAQRFGARLSVPDRVVGLRLDRGHRVLVLENGAEIRSRCVLVASGVEYGRLDIEGLRDFEGAGVYYAATEMEASLCRGDEVVVVGGGNSAGQAVVFLSRYAKTVHVVLRSTDLGKSMSRYLVDRVQCLPNVVVHYACEISALSGNGHLSGVHLGFRDGRSLEIATHALFLFIGAAPHTGWLRGCVQLDAKGFVLTGHGLVASELDGEVWGAIGRTPALLETSLPGVFAAGDARAGSMKRVASAVGEGAMSVSLVHAHIGAAAR